MEKKPKDLKDLIEHGGEVTLADFINMIDKANKKFIKLRVIQTLGLVCLFIMLILNMNNVHCDIVDTNSDLMNIYYSYTIWYFVLTSLVIIGTIVYTVCWIIFLYADIHEDFRVADRFMLICFKLWRTRFGVEIAFVMGVIALVQTEYYLP